MFASDDRLILCADETRAVVDVASGGRLSSLTIAGSELIWNGLDGRGDSDPMVWGMYPMVPFAGRILRGEFTFDGVEYAVPQFHEGNAIHGYGFVNSWERIGKDTISWQFRDPWPFAGRATQRFELTPESLMVELSVVANERQPMSFGWHPWFRRTTSFGTADLTFPATSMYQRDSNGMPGRLVPVPSGPWDDCFTDLTGPPTIRWGDLTMTLLSDFDHWVVYDERDDGFCVEPQSGPPNEVNGSPRILDEGETMTSAFTLEFVTN